MTAGRGIGARRPGARSMEISVMPPAWRSSGALATRLAVRIGCGCPQARNRWKGPSMTRALGALVLLALLSFVPAASAHVSDGCSGCASHEEWPEVDGALKK